MQKKITIAAGLLAMALMAFGGPARAEDLKSRMHQRLPQIVDLKAKGKIGENNQGYLEARNGTAAFKGLIDAENKDRRMVYEAIAKQNNISIDVVGRRRAMQIAARADKGDWLQNEAGQWYQKQ
jgi:uncharacterized protein YdbL (DUF1318 family)